MQILGDRSGVIAQWISVIVGGLAIWSTWPRSESGLASWTGAFGLRPYLLPILFALAIVVAAALHVMSAIVKSRRSLSTDKRTESGPVEPPKAIEVRNQRFLNEKVLLDGHSYIGCHFENVTFEYNGGIVYEFSFNEIRGFRLFSNNPSVTGTVVMLKGLGMLNIPIVGPQWQPIQNVEPPMIVGGTPQKTPETPEKKGVAGFGRKSSGETKSKKDG